MGHLLRNTTTIFITLRPPDQEETTPAEIIKHLQHIRRQAFWRDNVPGGTWALEAATDGHRLYWHLHIIAEYRYFVGMPIWDFSNELLRAWGARFGTELDPDKVHIREIDGSDTGEAQRTVRYPHKPPELDNNPALLRTFVKQSRGLHLMGTFGAWRNTRANNSLNSGSSMYYTQHPDTPPSTPSAPGTRKGDILSRGRGQARMFAAEEQRE
jgi:hypothetical protein